MDYITISRFSIPVLWLAFFGAVLYLEFTLKKQHGPTLKMIDCFVWQYLIVWKLSYIVFSFKQFIAAPSSIIYFDGGVVGHILALLSISVVMLKKRDNLQIEVIIKAWVHFVSGFHVLYFAFTGYWVLLVVWAMVAIGSWKVNVKWILVGQWLLTTWISGWEHYFVYGFVVIFIIELLQKRKAQLLALAVITGLISAMLSEFEFNNKQAVREEITLLTTTGEFYRLLEQQEKYVIVNFFATWCLPCNAEMPHLQSFASNLPQDTQLVGVNLTKRDHGEEALQNFMNKFHVTYPILLDVDDVFGKGYGVLSIPTTVVLKDGVEVQRFVGPVSEQQLRKVVEK